VHARHISFLKPLEEPSDVIDALQNRLNQYLIDLFKFDVYAVLKIERGATQRGSPNEARILA
jgi:hypothetical protein